MRVKKEKNNNKKHNNNKSGGWGFFFFGGGYLDRRDRKRIDSRSVATSSGSLFQTATVLWRKEKLPIISSAVVYGRGKWVGTVRVFWLACWDGLNLLSILINPWWNLHKYETLAPLRLDCRKYQFHFWQHTRSGELRAQKLKSHLMRTQNLNVLYLKPGVGQNTAIHATLTARDFFLACFCPSGPFTCIFSQTSPDLICVGCG